MTQLTQAIQLALAVHASHTDQSGLPYILHPLRLMLRAKDDAERIVAVLHDVVEDCEQDTSSDIRRSASLEGIGLAFGGLITAAVDAISRREGETYSDYIDRAARNRIAMEVKILDLKDNMDPERISTCMLPASTLIKYKNSLYRLTNGCWPPMAL